PMSTNIAFNPISMSFPLLLKTLQRMLPDFLPSTLYLSSRLFSSSATRDSSFSTLSMSLLPVLCEERPKIFFTLSIIKLKCWCDHNENKVVHCLLDRYFIVNAAGVQMAGLVRAPVDAAPRRAVQKSCGAAALQP